MVRVRFLGESSPVTLLNGKVYDVLAIEAGFYRVFDETDEDYLYAPQLFEIVSPDPAPPNSGDPSLARALTL